MKIFLNILTVVIILLSATPARGEDKFHIHLDYNYLLGLYEKGAFLGGKSKLSGFDIHLAGMYDINKRLSLGAGVGVEKLANPWYTIFPVFAKALYSPLSTTDKPYVFTKLGYGIGTEYSNAGLLFNPGVGYRIMFRKHFGINFMLGYHLQSVRYDVFIEDGIGSYAIPTHNNRHSLSFGVGFIF
ncbi:MAG: hypothetical protein LBV32_07805 [Tannerellaceae bacterium]|jgi:hypothetical protein|nr:hypothetical protein [Tannerellaceae bacterium]